MKKTKGANLSARAQEIFSKLKGAAGEVKTELEWTNSYTLLVAVTLSAQSTDVQVNKATKALFRVVQTPSDMLELGEEGLKEYIKSIGLFNTKAKNIINAAHMLIKDYNGDVPQSLEELQQLPGVGRKTANVVLNVAFNQPTVAVDTHVFRVSRRLGLSQGQTPEQVESDLLKITPKQYGMDAHHLLILHGRYICKAKNPACDACHLAALCDYFLETKA